MNSIVSFARMIYEAEGEIKYLEVRGESRGIYCKYGKFKGIF